MRSKNTLPTLAAALTLAACSAPSAPEPSRAAVAPSGSPSASASASGASGAPPAPYPLVVLPPQGPFAVAGRTDEGDIALFDADTGAVLSQAEGAGLGGDADIACDPWHGRVIVFEGDEEGQWGEIAHHPVTAGGAGPELGARVHDVGVDGVAVVASSPYGLLRFEDGYGPQWALLPDSGGPLPSVYGPRPASIDLGFNAGGDFEVRALTYGQEDDSLDLRSAVVSPAGIAPGVPLSLPVPPASGWPSTRWVHTAAHDWLVAAVSGDVVLSASGPAGFSPFASIGAGPGVRRVEHAAALAGDRLALLVSSDAGDSDVVVVALDNGGAALCNARLDLPGAPRQSLLFFSRDLLVVGPGRLLAATSAGVFAITVTAGCPVSLDVDPAWSGDALRGPLDACGLSP